MLSGGDHLFLGTAFHNRHEKSCKTNTENMKQLTDPQISCHVENTPPFFLLFFPVALLLTS